METTFRWELANWKTVIRERIKMILRTLPGQEKEIDIEVEPWFLPEPPRITKIKCFEEESEFQMEGITSNNTHYTSGDIYFLYDDEEESENKEDWNDDMHLNIETLCSIADELGIPFDFDNEKNTNDNPVKETKV